MSIFERNSVLVAVKIKGKIVAGHFGRYSLSLWLQRVRLSTISFYGSRYIQTKRSGH